MSYVNKLLSNLEESEMNIRKEEDKKIEIIENFLTDIKDICDIFYNIWEEKEKEIESNILNIGKKYNFKFLMGGSDDFALHNIMRTLSEKFPIYNDNQEHIIDSLPRTNSEWSIVDKSSDELINIEVTPIDIYSRYPTDPENNGDIFNYIIKEEIHNQLLLNSDKEKKDIINEYFNNVIVDYLNEVEKKVQKKSDVIKKSLQDIDFNNPDVMAELRSKLNNI